MERHWFARALPTQYGYVARLQLSEIRLIDVDAIRREVR